jgi:hypothetical protein
MTDEPKPPDDGKKKRQLRTLKGLDVEQFRHPSDAKATDALKKIPGLDKLLAKILEYGLERLFYVENVASNIRVTPKMFPRLHKSLTWATKILDVPEPELYVKTDPEPNAYIRSHQAVHRDDVGPIDVMSDEELGFLRHRPRGRPHQGRSRAVRHDGATSPRSSRCSGQATPRPRRVVSGQGSSSASTSGTAAPSHGGIARGAAVRAGSRARARHVHEARGRHTLLAAAEMDRAEFLRQVREYEEVDRSTLDKAYKVLLTLYRTHPFAMQRAKEIEVWFSSGYPELMAGLPKS